MLDRPPASSGKGGGPRTPATWNSSHGASVASLMPSGAVAMWGLNLSVASLRPMADVTDQSFEQDVMERSKTVAVVVDLWAEWCGPCKTLGPILEKVIDETDGVELVKVDVDANPSIARAFQVQSIPAVYALKDGKIVDGFVGAQPEAQVREFVSGLAGGPKEPTEVERLVELGDEDSLRRALDLEADNEDAIVTLGELLV